ncbi:hypothetical protein LCGC14_2299380 [marine sediment metagenome]|uniref:Uncharacterized protein n=1 Tax=marine sediment metagenome TaxID=412755 RepID=A0A0F9CNV5_9ZZZZ
MVDNVDVYIEEHDKYFRVEFWIDGWKFHSAKMPIEQAEKLRKKFTIEEKK